MTCCTVKGCHNASHNHNKDMKITFHSFPSNPIIAARWIEKIRLNRKEECWKPTKYTKICSEHFDDKEKYTTKGGLCKLRQGAVPTKGLHIFCKDERQHTNDDLYDALDQDKTQQDESSKEANKNYSNINSNEALDIDPLQIPQENDEDMDSIFDSPQQSALRKQLAKKISLQRKHSKQIKMLQQKARRLKKKNMSLKKNLNNLTKEKLD